MNLLGRMYCSCSGVSSWFRAHGYCVPIWSPISWRVPLWQDFCYDEAIGGPVLPRRSTSWPLVFIEFATYPRDDLLYRLGLSFGRYLHSLFYDRSTLFVLFVATIDPFLPFGLFMCIIDRSSPLGECRFSQMRTRLYGRYSRERWGPLFGMSLCSQSLKKSLK